MELQFIQSKIYVIRGQKVILDFDLAEMYGTETKKLKQAVRRNMERFPEDFMFQLNKTELENLRSQFVSSNYGGIRYMPFAFTEQGVAMLSSVLRSKKAIEMNIAIVRAFVVLRQYLSDYKDLKEHIEKLENEMNLKFQDIHQALNYLLKKDQVQINQSNRRKIGYKNESLRSR